MSPSHLHLEVKVRARHMLLVVLVKALVLGHSEVILPVSRDPWGQENKWGKSSHIKYLQPQMGAEIQSRDIPPKSSTTGRIPPFRRNGETL